MKLFLKICKKVRYLAICPTKALIFRQNPPRASKFERN